MRVTNERAQSALKAHHITGNMTKIIKDYAADLLEARELIKEMREALEVVRDNTLNPAHTMTMLGLQETTNANHRLSLAILERTKEPTE